jgi:hypothetical protein
MVFITFSAYGSKFPARAFVAQHEIDGISSWARGASRRIGQEYQDSDFMAGLPDAETTVEAIRIITSFLVVSRQWISVLPSAARREFHVGMTVGENASFAPRLELPVTLLCWLQMTSSSTSLAILRAMKRNYLRAFPRFSALVVHNSPTPASVTSATLPHC